MSNLPFLESRLHCVSAQASAVDSDMACAPGATDLMVQVIRSRETDGGAVVGRRIPALVAEDAVRDRDGEDVAIPFRLPREAAVADVPELAEVELDLMVGTVAVPA